MAGDILKTEDNTLTPDKVLDSTDPGDETQRNFRYQHAYGVILLVAAARKELPYHGLWCENHEDFLCGRSDSLFDAYQIKTRKSELGHWTLNNKDMRKSFKRFADLMKEFGDKINDLCFVTNCEFLDTDMATTNHAKLANSPATFFTLLKDLKSSSDLPLLFDSTFKLLCTDCNCDADLMWTVLKKIKLIKGPGRDSFDSEIAQDHLSKLADCESLNARQLNSLRDELIEKVYLASSLSIDDPKRHWHCINDKSDENPLLNAKYLGIEIVHEAIQERDSVPFRFYPETATLELPGGNKNLSAMKKKLIKGNLSRQIETMQRRTLSAEAHLIELAHADSETFESSLNQIVNVVQGECDESELATMTAGRVNGPEKLKEVFKRLRLTAKDRPNMVQYQEYECLVGVAGLLTGECKVWWSEPFDLGTI